MRYVRAHWGQWRHTTPRSTLSVGCSFIKTLHTLKDTSYWLGLYDKVGLWILAAGELAASKHLMDAHRLFLWVYNGYDNPGAM